MSFFLPDEKILNLCQSYKTYRQLLLDPLISEVIIAVHANMAPIIKVNLMAPVKAKLFSSVPLMPFNVSIFVR